MANEFQHKSIGAELTQSEFEAVGGHILDSQAIGDLIYATSAIQLSRLGIGATGAVLTVTGGVPAWDTTWTPTGHLIPAADDSYDLGSAAAAWQDLYLEGDISLTDAGSISTAAGALTIGSAAAINITPTAGSAILLDGTISIDAGVVTGATSITSTAFAGALTGNVTGNASGTAATVTSGTQAAITTLANVTTVGALDAGSISTNFGVINNGASAITTTGLVSAGSLTVTGTTTLNGNLVLGDAAADTLAISATIQGATPLVFEGGTAGDYETSFAITNPSADRTITFPDATLTVNAAANISGTTLASNVVTSSLTTVGALNAGSITSGFTSIDVGAGAITTTGALSIASMGTNWTNAGRTVADMGIVTTIDINGGTINGITDLAVADGGTGASSAAAGFNALSPMTAAGDIIYGGASGTGTRLAKGSDAQVLTLASGVPTWATSTVGDITSVVAGTGLTGGGTSGDATLNVIGGTGITANADDIAIDSTVTTLTGTQTLTNKTLTAPTLTTPALGTPASGVMTNMTGAVTASIVDDAITLAKMASGTDGNIISYDASGNPVAVATGTDGQVLTSTGAGSPPAFEDASAGGAQTHSFVANGAITAGDLVSLLADGKVSTTASAFSAQVQWDAGNSHYWDVAYDTNLNKVVIVYQDGGNSSYGTAVVGTIAGGAITFGTPVVFNSASSLLNSVCFDSTTNKVVIAYRDAGNSNYGTGIVGTVSGTSISFGTAAVFASATPAATDIAFDSNTGDVVIAWLNQNDSQKCTAVVGVVSGTDISFGTNAVLETGYSYRPTITFDVNAAKMVICYQQSNNGYAIVGTVSGTDISFGSRATFETSTMTTRIQAVYDPDSLKVVITYALYSGGDLTVLLGTVSGTDITFGAKTLLGARYYPAVTYDTTLNKVVLAYYTSSTALGNEGFVALGTVSGTTISFGDAQAFYVGGPGSGVVLLYDPDSNRTVIVFEEPSTAANPYRSIATLFNAAVTTTIPGWVGIADADTANAAACPVRLLGSVASGQTSLTIASTYYLQTDGTLGTEKLWNSSTIAATREVGRAVSATEILITQPSVL